MSTIDMCKVHSKQYAKCRCQIHIHIMKIYPITCLPLTKHCNVLWNALFQIKQYKKIKYDILLIDLILLFLINIFIPYLLHS